MINKLLDEQNDMDLENNFISNTNHGTLLISQQDIEEELKIEDILHNNDNNNKLDNTDSIRQINKIFNSFRNDEKIIKTKNSTIKQLKKSQTKSYHTKALNRNKNSQSRFTKRHSLGIEKVYSDEQDIHQNDVSNNAEFNPISQKAKKIYGSKRNAYKTYSDLVSTLQYLSKFDWLENNSVNSKYLPGF